MMFHLAKYGKNKTICSYNKRKIYLMGSGAVMLLLKHIVVSDEENNFFCEMKAIN